MKGKVKNCVQFYRSKKDMTQEELAREAMVSRQTIISLEKGDYVPSVYLALKICEALDKSVEEVFECVD